MRPLSLDAKKCMKGGGGHHTRKRIRIQTTPYNTACYMYRESGDSVTLTSPDAHGSSIVGWVGVEKGAKGRPSNEERLVGQGLPKIHTLPLLSLHCAIQLHGHTEVGVGEGTRGGGYGRVPCTHPNTGVEKVTHSTHSGCPASVAQLLGAARMARDTSAVAHTQFPILLYWDPFADGFCRPPISTTSELALAITRPKALSIPCWDVDTDPNASRCPPAG